VLNHRQYSATTCNWKKKNDVGSADPNESTDSSFPSSIGSLNFETINASNLSAEEIEQIIEEEEAILQAQMDAKRKPKDWQPGQRKGPLKYSYDLTELEYQLNPGKFDSFPWTLRDKRCGVIAIKLGMMPLWDPMWGIRHACTVLSVDHNFVLGHKTVEQHGYNAIQVAAGQRKRKNVGKSVLGQYYPHLLSPQHLLDDMQPSSDSIDDSDTESLLNQWIKSTPPSAAVPYIVREFRLNRNMSSEEASSVWIPVGTQIHAAHFVPGQNVDVAGVAKGKGFQGAMKKHHFKGMPASHGVSKSHRALGSTGQCQDPGKVFKGKKMAGRMGNNRVTVQNLRIIKVDRGRNLLFVQGAIPGSNGTFVEVRDAVKKPLWNTEQVLNQLDRPPLPTFDYDPSIDGCGQSGFEAFMPLPNRDPMSPDQD
jgi:large subunit ribosomal protein L3